MTGRVIRIDVVGLCGSSRVSRQDGKRLREAIEQAWREGEAVELDFGEVRIASVSFLDEGVALLALENPLSVIKEKIRVTNIGPKDRQLLNSLLGARARERAELPHE
jgi:hypothetical protein